LISYKKGRCREGAKEGAGDDTIDLTCYGKVPREGAGNDTRTKLCEKKIKNTKHSQVSKQIKTESKRYEEPKGTKATIKNKRESKE